MKVQTRLSLFSSIIFGIIFTVIAIFIYTLYLQNGKKTIYNNLTKMSYITAIFYLEEDELNREDFAKIKVQFDKFVTNSFYQLYDANNNISYGSHSLIVDDETLDKIRSHQKLQFNDDKFFCYGIFYEDNQGDFVVIAREKKETLNEQLNMLLWVLIPAFFIGILVIIISSRWIAQVAYRPFRDAINQVNNISTNNLEVQIQSPQTNDELQDLITTFNKLLAKISETFIIQKNFVSYVSHEFKTPLASMLGNLEVFSIKDRNSAEYQQLSQKLIQQINQLEDILNTLIIISDLRKDTDAMNSTRIDELIWEIIDRLSEQYTNTKILVKTDISPKNEYLLNVHKDRTQLLMALFNLIENAVKYSQGKPIEIHIYKDNEDALCISIKDNGIGIPIDQLNNISKPFYRADNVNKVEGSGIGLSIALKILEKNAICYKIESQENIGSTVLLIFKSCKQNK